MVSSRQTIPTTPCLLQLIIWTSYVLHLASARDCYLCSYITGKGSTCNCKDSPKKGCKGLTERTMEVEDIHTLSTELKVSASSNTTKEGRNGHTMVCIFTAGLRNGVKFFFRSTMPNPNDEPFPESCDIEDEDYKRTTGGITIHTQKVCLCDSDYCNNIKFDLSTLSASYIEFRWRSISLALIVVSICQLQ